MGDIVRSEVSTHKPQALHTVKEAVCCNMKANTQYRNKMVKIISISKELRKHHSLYTLLEYVVFYNRTDTGQWAYGQWRKPGAIHACYCYKTSNTHMTRHIATTITVFCILLRRDVSAAAVGFSDGFNANTDILSCISVSWTLHQRTNEQTNALHVGKDSMHLWKKSISYYVVCFISTEEYPSLK